MNSSQIIQAKHFNKRPAWFELLNRVLKITGYSKTKILKDDLIRAARHTTGLHNFGDEPWEEPLEMLLRSVNEEACLHPVGIFISKQRLTGLLKTRLRAEEMFRKNPGILDNPLLPAWIILGLQRTGTTKLHRLLASDPDHRVLKSWEAINPAPRNVSWKGKDNRVNAAKLSVRALKFMAPGFFAIHPIGYDLPEEDILLLDASFLSTTPEATMHVPSYSQWLENTDQSDAYRYEVKLLKLLQWQYPGKRWILKSPHHLEFPHLIEKHFSETRYIFTHRNIYESIPSFLSMVAFSRAIFSDNVDPGMIAEHWIRKTGYMLDKTIEYRRKDGNEQKFTDVFYDSIVHEPLSVLEKIYSAQGGFSEAQGNRFRETDKQNPFRKYGTHKYSLTDFNITEKDLDLYTLGYQKFMTDKYGKKEAEQIQ